MQQSHPHHPRLPHQRYALTEPTGHFCDAISITARLGITGKLSSFDHHLGQEVLLLENQCSTVAQTAAFLEDLISKQGVELHFFDKIVELLEQRYNIAPQLTQLHAEKRGTHFTIAQKSLVESAGDFPFGFPVYRCKGIPQYLLQPRSLPCFGNLKTIDLRLIINFTGWDNFPRLADSWFEEQQSPHHSHGIFRREYQIGLQVSNPPPRIGLIPSPEIICLPPTPKPEKSSGRNNVPLRSSTMQPPMI
jgi:hypothetical protein